MQVIKTNGYNENFDVLDFSELQEGDLFFTSGDVYFTCENGEFYLDYQLREKQAGKQEPGKNPIIDGGGVVLIGEYWQCAKNDLDNDNGGAPSDLFDFLAYEIETALDYNGLKDALNICKTALDVLKNNLWYFE